MGMINSNFLINGDWLDELEASSGGDEALAAKKLWYICLSARDGELVASEDKDVDNSVAPYFFQIQRLRNKSLETHTKRTNKEQDELITKMCLEGCSSADVAEVIYGDRSKKSSDAIRGRKAWKKAREKMERIKEKVIECE